jgi:4-amino-4-deoxy-L-arabinose transferase-like glycosyltransferase
VDRSSPSRRLTWGLLAVTLVGFGARVWQLDAQSLWLDEALSVVFSRPGLRQMYTVLVTQDLHPPLYYVTLHFWMLAAGSGEFSVRFLSVLAGVPAVPATYVLGSLLFRERGSTKSGIPNRGQQVGLIGASLVAVSPFLVYYSQEARMYSALATFGVLSSCALWKLLEAPNARRLLVYVLFTSATLYTQYFGGFVLAFQAIYCLGVLARDRRRATWSFSAMAAVALTYVPWLPGAYLQIQRLIDIPDFWKGDFQLSFMLTHLFGAFALGHVEALTEFGPLAALPALVVVGGIGLLAFRAFRRGGGELYVLTYILVPLVLLYAVVSRDPKFTERYLIMIVPPFYLVLGLAFVGLGGWVTTWKQRLPRRAVVGVASLAGLALIVGSLIQLWQIYYGPGYRKDDNRGAIAYIEAHAQPGDVTVLMMDTWEAYEYYSNGTVPWLAIQPGGDLEKAVSELNQVTAGHRRIWLLEWNPEWADPSGFARQSIAQAYREENEPPQFQGLELKLYLVDPSYQFTIRATPGVAASANFGNKLSLLGYDLPNERVTAGQSGQVALYWTLPAATNDDYIISVRLTDGRFYWWRHDDRPTAFNYPTMYWHPGQVVRGLRDFDVPPGTPPGTYYLELGVYAQGNGADLNVLKDGHVAEGTTFRVAKILVDRPASAPTIQSLGIPPSPGATFADDLRLLGATVLTSRVIPGGSVDATLWWQALRPPSADYRVQLLLRDGAYQKVVDDDRPASGTYPTTTWATGEVVVDRHRFLVPTDAPPGQATLTAQLVATGQTTPIAANGDGPVSIGSFAVLDHQRLTTAPKDIQHTADWKVGTFARLVGSTLSATSGAPGDHVGLTLYWQALGSSGDVGYTVFVHLLDGANLVKAQQDHPPGNGDDPTTGWIAGEYVVDHYDLTIAPDSRPGTYQLEVGMYDPKSGSRLPVADGSGKAAGDRLILGSFQVR